MAICLCTGGNDQGGNPRDVASVMHSNFSWAADSKSLYFISSGHGKYAVNQLQLADESWTEIFSSYDYTLKSLATSPDGRTLAFSSWGSSRGKDSIFLLDLHTKEVKEVVFEGNRGKIEEITNIFWSPNGWQMVFQSGKSEDGQIYIVNRDGSGLKKISERDGFSPSWCPDGEWITFATSTKPEQVMAVSADGSKEIASQIIEPIYHSLVCGLPRE